MGRGKGSLAFDESDIQRFAIGGHFDSEAIQRNYRRLAIHKILKVVSGLTPQNILTSMENMPDVQQAVIANDPHEEVSELLERTICNTTERILVNDDRRQNPPDVMNYIRATMESVALESAYSSVIVSMIADPRFHIIDKEDEDGILKTYCGLLAERGYPEKRGHFTKDSACEKCREGALKEPTGSIRFQHAIESPNYLVIEEEKEEAIRAASVKELQLVLKKHLSKKNPGKNPLLFGQVIDRIVQAKIAELLYETDPLEWKKKLFSPSLKDSILQYTFDRLHEGVIDSYGSLEKAPWPSQKEMINLFRALKVRPSDEIEGRLDFITHLIQEKMPEVRDYIAGEAESSGNHGMAIKDMVRLWREEYGYESPSVKKAKDKKAKDRYQEEILLRQSLNQKNAS
jgi:hypothetical protein